MDKIVLEQVFQAILPAVRAWLMRSGPTTLDQTALQLENYFLAEQVSQAAPLQDKGGGRGKGRQGREVRPDRHIPGDETPSVPQIVLREMGTTVQPQ